MVERSGQRGEPGRLGIVVGLVSALVGIGFLATPIRAVDTPGGVHLWSIAIALIAFGAWFTWAAFLLPRSRTNPSLRREDIDMPHDPAIYDPADYERRPGYVTEVDGRTGQTPIAVAVSVASLMCALFVGGLIGLDRWIAWPFAIGIAVVAWQIITISGRRRN
ncbi:hypothetical protein [Curtobacterium sp. 18060]|uniref:hypothetical protein n=1 Tax=Curtobacterium sp. 18060 TaxID=2681408 RepID=UPI001357200F|nr:hypothetical protein [Curtobacterium sp. 18060]